MRGNRKDQAKLTEKRTQTRRDCRPGIHDRSFGQSVRLVQLIGKRNQGWSQGRQGIGVSLSGHLTGGSYSLAQYLLTSCRPELKS